MSEKTIPAKREKRKSPTGKSHRRAFLTRGGVLGASLAMLGAEPEYALTASLAGEASSAVNETLKTIHGLRTIHGNFLDKPLPDSALETILQASVRAANASNMQSYSIVVVKDRAIMKQLCTYQGSCMLLYCVDFTRLRASGEHLGYAYFPDNIVTFLTASINASLAVQTAVIAARSLGIDSLITNGIHRGDMERIWKLVDLPLSYCFPLIAVVLGYPDAEPASQKGRLSGPGVIHYEKYHQLTKEEVEEIMRQCDDPERHLALNEDWRSRGYKHYFDWYFKDWLGDSKPTEKETQMLRLLKRSGFVELQKAAL